MNKAHLVWCALSGKFIVTNEVIYENMSVIGKNSNY